MVDFSLVLPSRGRRQLLRELLESVRETTDRLEWVEVLIAVDHDDVDMVEWIAPLQMTFPFVTFTLSKQQNGTTPYYNELARHASGRYLWPLNDDCVLTSKGWDSKALPYLEQQPHRAFLGKTRDNLHDRPFAMFPLLSREAWQVQGWLLNPMFPGWRADENLHEIWSKLGRVVDCSMITIEHRSHWHGTRKKDSGCVSMEEAWNREGRHLASQAAEQVDAEAERIRNRLEPQPVETA